VKKKALLGFILALKPVIGERFLLPFSAAAIAATKDTVAAATSLAIIVFARKLEGREEKEKKAVKSSLDSLKALL